MNFNDFATVSIKESDYRIHFWYMRKNDAINLIRNSNLNENSGSLQFFIIYKNDWNNLLSKKQRCYTKQSKSLL